MTKQLDEIFDVEPTLVANTPTALVPATSAEVVVAEPLVSHEKALEDDFTYARDTITNSINDVKEAAKSAILLAQSGDSPRAYEVVATMLTAIVNANKELVHLHKARKDAAPQEQKDSGESGNVTIEKAVFVGRAADLLRELRSIQKDTK